MARVLVVLACAVAAAATRYTDYAGGKMPQYANGGDYDAVGEPAMHSDDYHGHSPDAPASLDYKYEEERRSKTDKPSKQFDNADAWRKVRRKQRGLQRPLDQVELDLNDFNDDEDEVPRRPSHVHAKRRPKLKNADDAHSPPHRRPVKYSRDRQIEVSDTRDINRDDILDDENKAFEDDDNFLSRETTRRVKRRKPRDRNMNFDVDLNTDDETVVADRLLKGDYGKESEYSDTSRRRPPDEREPRQRYRPLLDDDEPKTRPTKQRQKIYDEYNDYYDMKRVQSIKQKLPELLRRTSTMKVPTKTPGITELLQELTANRRLDVKPAPKMSEGSDSESDSGEIVDIMASHTPTKTSSVVFNPTTLSDTIQTIIWNSSTIFAPANTSQELSLAEKSRLSILKKAQRKYGVKEQLTNKPPVLLQVTQKLATVIMVEPPMSRQPWLPPHELTGDTPERMERVKKLMRHKLVAQAKSMQELTDNWDEMVCDYIDVSMLDNGTPTRFPTISFNYVFIIPLYVLQRSALS